MKVYFVSCIVPILYFSQICYALDAFGAPPFDMSNLGSIINDQVQNHVKAITSKVNEEVFNINQNIHKEMNDFSQNLAQKMNSISENVESQIKGLTERIHANVENSMKPLHAIMIKSAMAHGVGGVTIANYGDKFRLLIINGNNYICPGEVTVLPRTTIVKCTENLIPESEDNICTESSYSRVNNIYCFGNQAALQCKDNSCQCKNGNMYTLNAMQNMCGPKYGTNAYVKYAYYPDIKDPNRIIIPNPNEQVKCLDANKGYCVWYGNGFVIPMQDI